MESFYIAGLIFLFLCIAAFWWHRYDRERHPPQTVRVKVLGKNHRTGVHMISLPNHRSTRNYYWGEFQNADTGEVLTLNIDDVALYTDLKEGQRGRLTYRKNQLLSYQPMGKLKRRKPSLGEQTLDFFGQWR